MLVVSPLAPVRLSFELLLEDGTAYLPVTLSWRLLDQNGVTIQDWIAAIGTLTAGVAHIDVLGALNILPAGTATQGRYAAVRASSAVFEGFREHSARYVIADAPTLAVPSEAFSSIIQADAIAYEVGVTPLWDGATQIARVQAIQQAHLRICRLGFGPRDEDEVDRSQSIFYGDHVYSDLSNLTEESFLSMGEKFRYALIHAEIAEAMSILDGDRKSDTDDLLSSKIGETAATFRPGRKLRTPLCSRAMEYLRPWLRMRIVIGR